MATFEYGQSKLHLGDCLEWLDAQPDHSVHGVVTDPPYGLVEYTKEQQAKLRAGKGGVWRIPPAFDGHKRAPLPRFTTLTRSDLEAIERFFSTWAVSLRRVLTPGAHVMLACNPLISPYVSAALTSSGLERRGEIARLVMTMRGGDRPKNAHTEFDDVTVMPRSQWEPWLLYRAPIETRTVAENLRKYKTGALRRISPDRPFGDVIKSHPTGRTERLIAKHPSLKPQAFLRQLVRAVLPLGEGVVLDPFAGSGSTLAAAEWNSYDGVGVEMDPAYFEIAQDAIPCLASLQVKENS